MPKRQTQTVTLTLSFDEDLDGYDSPLDALRDVFENDTYADDQNFDIEVVDAGEVETTGGRTPEQKARLLELKGWAFAEQQKKDRGLPSEWIQDDWLTTTSCGTACCIAGKVALDDGGQPAANYYDMTAAVINPSIDEGLTYSYVILPNGRNVSVDDYASEALGLDGHEAQRLFYGHNDYDTIASVIDELVAD